MTKQITNITLFKPLPKSRGKIGMYICEAPNATEAYAGEYSVRITFNGCAINAKTTLAINSCDNLYIKAFNPLTNVETNKLIRKPNIAAKNEYEDLILQVETLDGKIIKTLNYTWDPPSGVTLGTNQNEPYKVQTNKLGRYTVQASSANGTSCPLSIDIFAEPCTIVGDAFNCNSTGGSTIDANQTDLANLAVGDEFTTSDYTIVVTEASKTGTTFSGKGKLIFNFLKISNTLALQIPISVTFTGIKINQCYQLYSGSVITEYDPSWSSILELDSSGNPTIPDSDQDQAGEIASKNVEIIDILQVFECSNNQREQLNELKTDLEKLASQAQANEEYSEAQKLSLLNGVTEIKNLINDLLACCVSSPNGRVATQNCIPLENIQNTIEQNNLIFDEISKNPANLACGTTDRGFSNYPDLGNPTWRIIFDKGTWAHNLIQMYYKELAEATGATVHVEYKIPKSNATMDRYGYADIVNVTTQEIFEIKSVKQISQGRTDLERYIKQANFYCPPGGVSVRQYKKGTIFPPTELFWPYNPAMKLVVKLEESGVITYDEKPNNNPVLEPTPVTFPVPSNVFENIKKFLSKSFAEPDPNRIGGYALEMFRSMSRVEVRTVMVGAAAGVAAYYYTTRGKNTAVTARVSVIAGIIISQGWNYLYN